MGLKEELDTQVEKIFADAWTTVNGQKIPDTEDVQLGNYGSRIEATILYADLAGSTNLVDTHDDEFAAEVYKAYLHCAVKIIRNKGGKIASFDGDRVMGIFFGRSKNTSAVMAALQINGAVTNTINPALKAQYPDSTYQVEAACGVDTSDILVARTGIRGNNDLVWVGSAANHAAKLCSLRESPYRYATYITSDVFNNMNANVKWFPQTGGLMWDERAWNGLVATVYGSGWWYSPSYNPPPETT